MAAWTRRIWQNWCLKNYEARSQYVPWLPSGSSQSLTLFHGCTHSDVKKSRPHGEAYYRRSDWQYQLRSGQPGRHQLQAVCVNEPSDGLFSCLWVFQLRPQTSWSRGKPSPWCPDWMSYNHICRPNTWLIEPKFTTLITGTASEVCISIIVLYYGIIIIDICYQFHILFYATSLRMCQGACEDYNFKYVIDVLATWRNIYLSYCPY